MMKGRIFWIILVLVTAGGAISYFFGDDEGALPETKVIREQESPIGQPPPRPSEPQMPSAGWSIMAISPGEQKDIPREELQKMFQTDEWGNLTLNEETRLNIEKIYALYTPEEREAKLRDLSTTLPPEAHRELVRFLNYFEDYVREAKILYPPDAGTISVDQAIDQLNGLHSLRVSYFGTDVAEAFYDREERIGRHMLELMRLEKDENLSPEEKAYRANLYMQDNPDFAAAHSPGPSDSNESEPDASGH